MTYFSDTLVVPSYKSTLGCRIVQYVTANSSSKCSGHGKLPSNISKPNPGSIDSSKWTKLHTHMKVLNYKMYNWNIQEGLKMST